MMDNKWKLKYAVEFDPEGSVLEVSGGFDYTDCLHQETITKEILDTLEKNAKASLRVVKETRKALGL